MFNLMFLNAVDNTFLTSKQLLHVLVSWNANNYAKIIIILHCVMGNYFHVTSKFNFQFETSRNVALRH